MGPDTLREMARIHDVFAGEPSLSDKLRAHADAWEADRQRLEAARNAIGRDGAGRLASINEGALVAALAAGEEE